MSLVEVEALLRRGDQSVDAAKILIDHGDFGFAASRAYYGMFYAAQAALLTRNQSYSRHSAVIASFGRVFVKSGLLGAQFHQHLREAFDLRQVGDYDPVHELARETADRTVERAAAFVQAVRQVISSTSCGEETDRP